MLHVFYLLKMHLLMSSFKNFLDILTRGVTVHKHDGSVRTSVLTLQFATAGGKTKLLLFIKQWFTEQIAISLNRFSSFYMQNQQVWSESEHTGDCLQI